MIYTDVKCDSCGQIIPDILVIDEVYEGDKRIYHKTCLGEVKEDG